MTTAEYAVGTVAASVIAATLLRLGVSECWDIVRAALRPGVLLELLEAWAS